MAVSKRRQFSAEKGICHISEDTIAKLPDPSGNSPDPLTDVIRSGARRLIEQAIEAELAALLSAFADHKLEDGRARLVRHGHLPEREILTGIGPVAVKVPRVRDRKPGANKITFTPSILPRYLRKAKSVEELLPWLYLKGVSTGDFSGEAPNAIRPRERAEPGRPAGAGRQGLVGQDHHAAEGGLVDGLSGLGEARPRHAPVSRSPDHSDGSRSRAHSGPTAPTSSHEWLMK
jgi:hypothetical protein